MDCKRPAAGDSRCRRRVVDRRSYPWGGVPARTRFAAWWPDRTTFDCVARFTASPGGDGQAGWAASSSSWFEVGVIQTGFERRARGLRLLGLKARSSVVFARVQENGPSHGVSLHNGQCRSSPKSGHQICRARVGWARLAGGLAPLSLAFSDQGLQCRPGPRTPSRPQSSRPASSVAASRLVTGFSDKHQGTEQTPFKCHDRGRAFIHRQRSAS